jgi:hypothetical protein
MGLTNKHYKLLVGDSSKLFLLVSSGLFFDLHAQYIVIAGLILGPPTSHDCQDALSMDLHKYE